MHLKLLAIIMMLMPTLGTAMPHTLLAAAISKNLQIGKTLTLSPSAQSVLGIMLHRDVPSIVKKKDLRGVGVMGKEKPLFAIAEHLNAVGGNLQMTLLEIVRHDDADAIELLTVFDANVRDNLKLRRLLLADFVDYISQPARTIHGTTLGVDELHSDEVLGLAYGSAFVQAIRRDNLQMAAKLEKLGAYIDGEVLAYVQSKEAIDYLATVIAITGEDALYGAFSMPPHANHLFTYYLSTLATSDLARVLLKPADDDSGQTFVDELYQLFTAYYHDMLGSPVEVHEQMTDVVLSRLLLAKRSAGDMSGLPHQEPEFQEQETTAMER
ncbi:MAG: hypothetical protein OYH77_01750 [Pseudomonadota bacterium]|nr:hypothetical protein [Pseudomonadota bacterium]